MVDITGKSSSLREAKAMARVQVSRKETIERIIQGTVPKGNVFEMARTAGLLGIKKTALLLPDCHPLPIEYAAVDFSLEETAIEIRVTVKTIYKTGVEVEAMHGASIVALTVYDMLKPIDPAIEILSIKLLEKTGGKSSRDIDTSGLKAEVVVCSDSVSRGEKEDRSGQEAAARLEAFGLSASVRVIPDEVEAITKAVIGQQSDLLLLVGGTGLGPRDITSMTVKELLDTNLPGVETQMLRYGQDRTPMAMLGRPLAGIRQGKLILCVPGSVRGATECINAVFPQVLHVFDVLKGKRHD